jgi:hypothetical protein
MPSLGLTSETGVIASDMNWQAVLAKVCNLTILLNQKDASSLPKLRPDFTGLLNNMLVIKGEAKSDSVNIPTAISELIDKFHATAHLMFPASCPVIPGIVSSRQLISLHRIYFDGMSQRFCEDLVAKYQILERNERIRFIQDIFKLAIWIISQTHPSKFFHLVTNVRNTTKNGHHMTLQRDGILKEFKQSDNKLIPMELIRAIYGAKLPNVEQGVVNYTSVTITTVGRRLQDSIRSCGLSKSVVLQQVQAAVEQLHGLGIAHCDICVDNIFVNVIDNVVFLGDLEYCQVMEDPAPTGIRRADRRARAGRDLDLIQLDKLRDELASLTFN